MPENTIWGVIVRIWQGVLRVGNRTATPTPASGSLAAGTVTIESAGNSTNGKLEMEATTSGGTVRKLTLAPSQSMSGNQTYTWPTAAPGANNYPLVSSTSGQLSFYAIDVSTLTNYWSRSGTIISPATANDRLEVGTNVAAAPAISGSNSSTTDDSLGGEFAAIGASGKVHGVSGATSSSDNAAYGGTFTRTRLGDWADVDEQGSDPATPPSGKGRYYGKSDGKAYYKNDAGTVYDLTATGGAATLSIHDVSDADYSASTSDDVIRYTSLSATRTVSLPAASSYGSGAVVTIKDGSGSAAFATNITIDPNSSETIDGAGTKKIMSAYGSLTLLSDGSNWSII